jgi:heme-degrading monooxygenase HmoA
MHARLNTFQLGSTSRGQVEKLADQFAPIFRRQQGFRSVTFILDQERGEYGSFSLWDSQQDAEAASEGMLQELQQAMSQAGLQPQGPLSPRLFEVYESKG